ncbi:MAG: hypothetical protein NTV86_00835 [Planctomycetota bacterium]|nr:hypothetical protein [Planctomycetota bacterium]
MAAAILMCSPAPADPGKAPAAPTASGNPGEIAREHGTQVTIVSGPEWIPLKLELDIEAGTALDFSMQGFQDAPSTSANQPASRPVITPEDPEVRAQNLLQLADNLMEAGKVEAAMERYRMILEQCPKTKAADAAKGKIANPE